MLAVAAAVGFGAWLLLRDDGDAAPEQGERTVAAVSEQGLRALADALGGPMYWLGPQSGASYELTQTASGGVFVRYLPPGVAVGSADPYPFVATFSVRDAFAVTTAEANKPGSVKIPVAGGEVAFYSRTTPENIYLAFPNSDHQIEVYDPNPARGRRLVSKDRVVPVSLTAPGAINGSVVTPATEARIRRLPAELDHVVYWLGPQSGVSYELTQTESGRVFVRYLPPGVEVGSSKPHPFVATFPVEDAFAVTTAEANKPGSVKIPVGRGGVAFYSSATPENIYLAFPDSNYQIEVFDPNPARGRQAVESGQVVPIR